MSVPAHYSSREADSLSAARAALYLALDFHPGADLASQLANWGCLGRDRARFYISEIIEGVEGLHRAGIIYRCVLSRPIRRGLRSRLCLPAASDLKPENVLIAADGHIVLTDFGLSKDFKHNQVIPPASDGLPRPHWLDHPSRSASTPPVASWLGSYRETTMTFCGTAEYLAPGTPRLSLRDRLYPAAADDHSCRGPPR